jgi:hypothetical protein
MNVLFFLQHLVADQILIYENDVACELLVAGYKVAGFIDNSQLVT